MKLRYTLKRGTCLRDRRLTVSDKLAVTTIIDLINSKNPGWRCIGWVPIKAKK